MATFLHCSDLHLTHGDEEEYSFGVLRNLVDVASRERVDAILMAGDMFDSFVALERVRDRFREALEPLPAGVRVLFLPGNHDLPRTACRRLGELDFGRAELLSREPFSLVDLPDLDCEVLAVPHQAAGYACYLTAPEWRSPEKRRRCRIVMAHATVPQLVGRMGEDEADGSTLDAHLFVHMGADYAALGHIHGFRDVLLSDCRCAYPGSSRVWRRGEVGPRGCLLVTTRGAEVSTRFLPLESAGEWRLLNVTVDLEAHPWGSPFPEVPAGPSDALLVRVSGLVANETLLRGRIETWSRLLQSKVRLVEWDTGEVMVVSDVMAHPLARRFLEAWSDARPPDGCGPRALEIWRRSCQVGLAALRDAGGDWG